MSPTRRENPGQRRVRAPRRGRFFRLLSPFARYIVPNLTVAFGWFYFRILNRTTVIGREHVGYDRNTLLLSNHQTMIDSFLVGMMCFYPQSWWKPYLIPWNPAAVENYYKNPFLAWFSDVHKCIPIREGRQDLQALRRMIKVFPAGVMTLFPEGTRMRGPRVGRGRLGAGMIMLSARPKVIPVAIDGMEKVLPIGAHFPRIFKHIYVSYGPPVDYSDLLDKPRNKDTFQQVVDRIMERIRVQHQDLRRRRGLPVPTYDAE
jgi:1-acyl-sn-glycerol-3-phosphate acyltransferase